MSEMKTAIDEQAASVWLPRLHDLASRDSAIAEQQGALTDDVVGAIRDSPLPGHFLHSHSFQDLTVELVELGKHCASSSWLTAVYAYTLRMAMYADPTPIRDFAAREGRAPLIAGALPPMGKCVSVDEGEWRVDGQWTYVSGIEFADMCTVSARTEDSSRPAEIRQFLIGSSDVEIVRTWDSMGLKATGSHTIHVDGVTVSDSSSVPMAELMKSSAPDGFPRPPLPAVAGLTFAPALVGAISQAFEFVLDRASGGSDDRTLERIGRAAELLDFAETSLFAAAGLLDEPGEGNHVRARARVASAFSACSSLVDEISLLAGTGPFSVETEFQRCIRDAMTARTHKFSTSSYEGFIERAKSLTQERA